MKRKTLCGIIIGEASSNEKAKEIADNFKDCPYVAFIATHSNEVFAIYFIPEKQRWWLEYVEEKPKQTLGVDRAQLFIVDKVESPEKFNLKLPKEKLRIAPCGADCQKCPSFSKCLCCPATIYYKGSP